ncbi:hypothetical protein Fcan01_16315 [Folsomia candida]|uniref:Uncharacterized protein n=2 Tax=Folsomia candida TaxID=158441 RepID=A0A226DU63_FOLCA|nr:hypothetical protein Fcan01_16315 [Folsomia candida]
MEFIPVPTLLQFTLVNSTWEYEARNHLHSRTKLHLYTPGKYEPQLSKTIANYMNKPEHHGYPKNLDISIDKQSNLTQFLSEFAQFAGKYSNWIQHLKIDWTLTSEKSQSHQFFEICSTFTNLKYFELYPFDLSGKCYDPEVVSTSFQKDLIPVDILFPSVQILSLNLGLCPGFHRGDETLKEKLVRDILPRFPNLRKVAVKDDTPQGEDGSTGWFSDFTNISSFSLRVNFWGTRGTHALTRYLPPRTLTLKCLELQAISFSVTPLYEQLIHRFSHCLEQFHLFLVNISTSGHSLLCDPCPLHIPILPKLKVFKISRSRNENACKHFLGIRLTFETECSQFPLNYAKQFPSLLKVQVFEPSKKWQRYISDQEFFEGVVPFLYATFLKENIPACQTLREFRFPVPLRAKFQLGSIDRSKKTAVWVDSSEYFARIRKTFPGVDYHVVNPVWSKERIDKVERLVKIAVDLGFCEETVSKGLRDGCLMDNNVQI